MVLWVLVYKSMFFQKLPVSSVFCNWLIYFTNERLGLQKVILFSCLFKGMSETIKLSRVVCKCLMSFEQMWLKSQWNCNLQITCLKRVAEVSVGLLLVDSVFFYSEEITFQWNYVCFIVLEDAKIPLCIRTFYKILCLWIKTTILTELSP